MEIRLTDGVRAALAAGLSFLMILIVAWVVVQPFGPLGAKDPRVDVNRSATTASIAYDLPQLAPNAVVVIERYLGKGAGVEVARTSDHEGRVFFGVPEAAQVLVTITALAPDGAVLYRTEHPL